MLFLGHALVSSLASPLKLLPQTALAIGMGYVHFLIIPGGHGWAFAK